MLHIPDFAFILNFVGEQSQGSLPSQKRIDSFVFMREGCLLPAPVMTGRLNSLALGWQALPMALLDPAVDASLVEAVLAGQGFARIHTCLSRDI